MKIIYMGTPEFAVGPLRAIYEAGHEVLAVVTQPDKAKGRGKEMQACEVKEYAVSKNIPVLQPMKIKRPEAVELLKEYAADLYIVAAFGQILSQEILDIPKYGCLNIHASLLPKYRGAAPILWAIINGETQTGITTMMTDIGMDTGDILLVDKTEILPDETAGELFERLSVLGAETLRRTLAALESGTLVCTPQDETQASKCPMLKKEHGKLDFSQTAQRVHNRVRGTNPWPGAFALLCGEPLKIHKTRLIERESGGEEPGLLRGGAKTGLFVACSDGWLEILELQSTGGRRMLARDFLAGCPLEAKVLS